MLPDDLLRPEAWPPPRPDAVELLETHVSWVLRGERDVFKVKKAVDLGFLDFRSLETRRVACEQEVRLNARLAPDTYLGVVPVTRRRDGTLALGGAGPVVDWAVHMRRLQDERRADTMLARGALLPAHVDAIAEAVARLHASSPVALETATRWASAQAVERNVRENVAQTAGAIARYLDAATAREIEQRQLAFVRDNAAAFAARIAAGRTRDGHGDLRLEHVYLHEEGLRVIDCIEFDERYRVADTCADVAFLSMDLAAHGRVDLAERFLARHARASGDYDQYALVDFYEGYRAWIRAKIATLVGRADEARRHFLLALACGRRPLMAPALVCVGGIIASGKSTVADALGDELSCPVVDTDRTRKQMLGVDERRPVHDGAWRGAYDVAFTDRVYGEVLRRASVVLRSGRPAVVDASFRSRAMREHAVDVARALGVPCRFVECRAPAGVCRERLARRTAEPGPSDGRLAIFDEFVARFEPFDEQPADRRLRLDTTRPLEQSLRVLREYVTTWPRGLVA